MNNVKKICLAFIIGLLFGGASLGIIQQRRYKRSYSDLESRYSLIENANNELRESNTGLIANNQRLESIQSRDRESIQRGQDIIDEFREGLDGSYETLDRIESGLNALEKLIDLFGSPSEDMADD